MPSLILFQASWDVRSEALRKTPRQGTSSSTVNVIWGVVNLLRVGAFDLTRTSHIVAFGLGLLLKGIGSAKQFGKFHGGNTPTAA